MDISSLKIDLKAVEQEFINAVVNQAEEKQVPITDISLVMFPMFKKGRLGRKDSYVTRIRIMSISNRFSPEVVKMRKLTMFDMTGHISKAIMEIFKAEVHEHNEILANQGSSHERFKHWPYAMEISEKLECYIQVDANENLRMTFVYDKKPIRPYSIREEFSAVDNLKVGDAVDPEDLDQIQGEVKQIGNE
jgi:hypothetical protein